MTSISRLSSSVWGMGWSASMEISCLVQRSPCALASIVGMPIASWGVLTITFVAPASAAAALPQPITPKALASSCGNPPIHWCKTVVTLTPESPAFSRYSAARMGSVRMAATSCVRLPNWP